MKENAEHLAPLGDSGWYIWRDIALRSAGFPAERVNELAAPELAAAADSLISGSLARPEYEGAYTRAVQSLSAAIRRTAADPLFREAVMWQNRGLVANCLDKIVEGRPRTWRTRANEQVIARHLQRYALKNDTIGFFGPVGWAVCVDDPGRGGDRMTVRTGDGLLSRRTVYFEAWAVDAIACALSREPGMPSWTAPRRDPTILLDGSLVHRPDGLPVPLTAAEAMVLEQCDGRRTVRELAGEFAALGLRELRTEKRVLAVLSTLEGHGLVDLTLKGPIEARPEVTLRSKLEAIGDLDLRDRVVAKLDRIVSAADAAATAAGDADGLGSALDQLNDAFTQVTGEDPTRRHGLIYAGRTLLYEDTVRDIHVEWGGELLDELSGPLGLVLDSARWLGRRIGAEYQSLFLRMYRRWSDRNSATAMPLARLVGMAAPHLYFSMRSTPAAVRSAVDDFQARWQQVLGPADESDANRRQFTVEELRNRVSDQFPAGPPLWASAVHHSPDIMLAAASPEAVCAGDYMVVLGELHLCFNSLEARVFVEQHPDPERLRSADASDHAGRRIYQIADKDAQGVTSRSAPPSAMLADDTVCWTFRDPSIEAPGRLMPLAALQVHEDGGRLVVRDRSGSFECPLLEAVGGLLSPISVNSFKPFAPMRHRPRITVDNLVVARESWRFPAAELTMWAAVKSEQERFLAVRKWRLAQDLPERGFYRTPLEDKPVFVDFSSLVLVNLFAKSVRLAAAEDGATIELTEILPDASQTWLQDSSGSSYTSEFRLIATDPLRIGN